MCAKNDGCPKKELHTICWIPVGSQPKKPVKK